jgi:PBP1b-binding outer membrane lipoprotein LpoB
MLFTQCSDAKLAQHHYKKAVKHGYSCIDSTDTITIERIDSVFSVINGDTIWKYYPVKYDTIIRFKTQYFPKTRYQLKTEFKTLRIKEKRNVQQLRINARLEKRNATLQKKIETANNKSINLLLIVVGLICLIILAFKFSK